MKTFAKTQASLLVITILIIIALLASSCSALNGIHAATAGATAAAKTASAPPALPVIPDSATVPDQEVLASLYKEILPSVVDIQVTLAQPAQSQTPLPFPFGLPEVPNAPRRGEGSGFVYDTEGHIITNNHVVQDAEQIVVYFSNGQWTEGKVVATDPQADLAVIAVTPPQGVTLRPLPLADPDSLQVGHWVVAFGTPFGLRGSMTLGIVSALGRGFPLGDGNGPRYTLPDIIQTDAAINPGNSGGPLLNLQGEVVGVNFAINSPVRANSGVGFAIPVSVVQRIVPALIAEGRYHYPYLGISGSNITPDLVKKENLPDHVLGAWVAQVVKDGPSDQGGVKPGDIITAIDDTPVNSFDDLVSYLINHTQPKQKVVLTVLRNGQEHQLDVVVGERPLALPAPAAEQGKVSVSAAEAVQIARQSVLDAGLLDRIDSAEVQLHSREGKMVWTVTLTGGDKSATVTIDAQSGDVVSLSVK